MAVRLDSLSVLLLPDSDENASSSESTLSEIKEFSIPRLDELEERKPLTPRPSPLTERKITTPRSSPPTARKPTSPQPTPLEIKPDKELQLAIARARDFASKATSLKTRSSKPSGLGFEKKETEVKTTALKLSRAAAAVEKKEKEEKTPTATPRAPTLDLKEAKTDAVPLDKLPISALTGKLLFHQMIVKLAGELEPILKDKSDETGQESDKIIKKSEFYPYLKEFPTEQNPGVLLTILELNEHCRHKPDDQNLLTNAILGTLRLLFRENEWQLSDGEQFFGKLYHMHTLSYGNRGFTPVIEVIDRGMAAEYLTPKSQKFMDDVTYDDQFEPITEILKKVDGDISDPKTKAAIAAVADNLFTKGVKKNHFVMSHNLHKAPIQGIPLINKTGIARGLAGAGEFQKIAILHKYNYMKDYLALHLSYIAKAKKEHLQAGSMMKYFEKKTKISGESCTVAFGGVGEQSATQSATKIKAISVTSAYQEEVYFFVEELEEETPKAPPNPKIPLMHRPLYKFELIPGTHYIRLQEASSEVREGILKMLGEIKDETKTDVTCAVKTAIRHHKELMLVEIIRQCGSMLSSRPLYGAIKTYVKNLPRPTKGELSDPTAFKAFKKKLLEVLIGAYVLVMNETLDSWYQDDIYEDFNAEISRGIIETGVMKIIKKATLEVFNSHKHPGKHLLKSIMSCCYDGDPQAFTAEI